MNFSLKLIPRNDDFANFTKIFDLVKKMLDSLSWENKIKVISFDRTTRNTFTFLTICIHCWKCVVAMRSVVITYCWLLWKPIYNSPVARLLPRGTNIHAYHCLFIPTKRHITLANRNCFMVYFVQFINYAIQSQ